MILPAKPENAIFHFSLSKFRKFATRYIVAAVVINPTEKGQPYEINIKGYLSSLIDSELSVIKMVAEEGFEPPTQGL